jgi:hypothetical protein
MNGVSSARNRTVAWWILDRPHSSAALRSDRPLGWEGVLNVVRRSWPAHFYNSHHCCAWNDKKWSQMGQETIKKLVPLHKGALAIEQAENFSTGL